MLAAVIDGIIWHYRSNTNDLGIIEQVYTNNGCHFPDDMSGMVVMDVGAHIGAASILAAKRGAQVFAFEPGSDSYQLLLANIKANKLDIIPRHVGVGEPGIKKLYLDSYNTGQNSEFLMYPELRDFDFEYMHMISMHEAIPEIGVDFLKLDCEGCEDAVINSLNVSIPHMYIEFHSGSRAALVEKLSENWRVEHTGYGYICESL